MTEKLKRCPFCEGSAHLYGNLDYLCLGKYINTFWGVGCKKCGAKKEWYQTEKVAIDEWNKRVNDNDTPN